ncbi:hypothetical protein BBP40_008856 [Aspergillus hancockii]|nr:hypothetical protein BBP40_008856 [Aspergillus hancockii]
MWSRYSRSLAQKVAKYQDPTERDLLEHHNQSLGFKQLDRVRIDCSFLRDSKWGVLGSEPSVPAWLLYLQLQFSQPADCQLVSANVQLTFQKLASSGSQSQYQPTLGPVLTEYFGPRAITGSVAHNQEEDYENGNVSQSAQWRLDDAHAGDNQWSLRAYTWPVEDDASGLHRKCEWIVKEASPPHQIILHRDQIRVGLVLQHDTEPFLITVNIDGQLQGNYSWFRFPRSTNISNRIVRVRVTPSGNSTNHLDNIAMTLNEELTSIITNGPKFAPTITMKRSRTEDDQPAATGPIKRLRRQDTISSISTLVQQLNRSEDYTVAWICALPLELAAARAMLDQVHDDLPLHQNDQNTYTLGNIGSHNIVIACLPAGVYGTTSAATVATQMLTTFRSIRISLMVGIGGGVPSTAVDIRLGDVVVSKPVGRLGGVVQYDYGKTVEHGRFEQTGALNKPPQALLTTAAKMQAEHMVYGSRMASYLTKMVKEHPMMGKFTHPGQDKDCLYKANYDHPGSAPTCQDCDPSNHVRRAARASVNPMVHYGLIASGNQVMKHGKTRDRLAQELGILCFEMEAAGLMDSFPCLVIRGISDYADSHKNTDWQEYAAASAAAYAKEFLSITPNRQVERTPKALESVDY